MLCSRWSARSNVWRLRRKGSGGLTVLMNNASKGCLAANTKNQESGWVVTKRSTPLCQTMSLDIGVRRDTPWCRLWSWAPSRRKTMTHVPLRSSAEERRRSVKRFSFSVWVVLCEIVFLVLWITLRDSDRHTSPFLAGGQEAPRHLLNTVWCSKLKEKKM